MSHPVATPRGRELPRRTQILAICGTSVALVLALGAAHLANRRPQPAAAAPAAAGEFRATAEERANIAVAPVQVRRFADVLAVDGKLATDDDRTTQILPPFTGRVTQVYVTAGQTVRRGQPLARFAANEVVQGHSDVATAAAAERQAQAQLAQARANLARQSALYKADAAAQKDLEQARTDLAAAETATANAHAQAAAALGRLRVLGVTANAAARDRGAAPGQGAQDATLVAPIDGVVIQRQLGEGQFVGSVAGGAAQPILAISDLRRLWLIANLRDSDAQAVRLGAPVQARIDALGGRVILGRVSYIAPSVDPTSRRIAVRAEIPNPGGDLRPEMFAQVSIVTGPARSAPAVPRSAVVFDGANARVWVSRPKGVFTLRHVVLGASQDGFVEIRGGLSPGERVAVGGALFLDEAGKGDE